MPNPIETLSQTVHRHALKDAHRPALTVSGTTTSYGFLDALADRFAAGLLREGAKAGEVIAAVGENSTEYVALMIAASRVDAVLAPLPVSATTAALTAMLRDSGARICFADPEVGIPGPPPRRLELKGQRFAEWLPEASNRLAVVSPAADAPATIIYSSGTTGMPKGIVQSQLYRSALLTGGAARGYTEDGVTLLATPLYSNTTLASFLLTFGVGGHVVLQSKFEAGAWLELAERHHATHAMLVPVMIDRILDHPRFASTDLSSFRMKYCTSAPFSVDRKRETLARWPGGLSEIYGMTEGGATFILAAHAHPDKLHTVGQLAAGCRVRILDDDDKDVASGAAGEIVGEAPSMMLGYHNQPEATAECRFTDADGTVWQRTGDIGQLDADGFLTIIGRKKDMIISGGFNIYPIDIETVLSGHPDILEASVVGVPDSRWGETPVAFVVTRPGSKADIKAWVNERVGRMQKISDLIEVDALPRNDVGKVLKRVLRDRHITSSEGNG